MYQGVPPNADSTFKKKLKEFDPKLTCVFDRRLERFVIKKEMAVGPPRGVLVVAGNENFRQPCELDIAMLWYADLWRHGGVNERIRKGEEHMQEYREKEDANVSSELRDVTKDDKLQLRRTLRQAVNDGKANSDFRRIIPKPKGKTAQELSAQSN